MSSSVIERLKKYERPIGLLARVLFYLFWVLFAVEMYTQIIAKSQTEPIFLFFTMFGGFFSVLFYLCIVYFSILGIAMFKPPSTVSGFARYQCQAKQLGSLVIALLFTYAALTTVAQNLTS